MAEDIIRVQQNPTQARQPQRSETVSGNEAKVTTQIPAARKKPFSQPPANR
jgi:hypothetical protein